MLSGFKNFILRGNVIELAVAVIIGAMFSAIVDSLVKGIIDPILAGVIGKPNFDEVASFVLGTSTVKPGLLMTAVVNFVIKAGVIYFFLVEPTRRLMERTKKEAPPAAPPAQEVLLTEIRDLLKKR
ncbi:MAG: large conductance mechanosensitive channel protein MscL [Myxococcaceae bacterium]